MYIGRWRREGRRIVDANSRTVRWFGVTAFRLLEFCAHGGDEAEVYLQWCQRERVNLVRVLGMANGLFRLSPSEGLAAIPTLGQLCDQYNIKCELVALADTASYNMDLRAHVRAVGQAIAPFESMLGQVANEHYHPSQDSRLHDPAYVQSLMAEFPGEVLCTTSTSQDDEALEPTGEYVTRHLDRGRPTWNQVRRERELENVSRETDRPVVDDEHIGAAEQEDPGRRWNRPDLFFGFGILARGFELGSTFHYEDGLQARVPTGRQLECFQAQRHGYLDLIPVDVPLHFENANNTGGWPNSPVRNADFNAVVRAYSFINRQGDREGFTVLVGKTGDPRVEWQNGWHPTGQVEGWAECPVLEIVR